MRQSGMTDFHPILPGAPPGGEAPAPADAVAALVIGGAMLLADASTMFVAVIGTVGGIAAMARASHERLKQRIEVLEKRLGRRNGAAALTAPGNFRFLPTQRRSASIGHQARRDVAPLDMKSPSS